MHNAAVYMGLQIRLWEAHFNSFGYVPISRIAGLYNSSLFDPSCILPLLLLHYFCFVCVPARTLFPLLEKWFPNVYFSLHLDSFTSWIVLHQTNQYLDYFLVFAQLCCRKSNIKSVNVVSIYIPETIIVVKNENIPQTMLLPSKSLKSNLKEGGLLYNFNGILHRDLQKSTWVHIIFISAMFSFTPHRILIHCIFIVCQYDWSLYSQ